MSATGPGRAPDLFTALELEPATATVPLEPQMPSEAPGLRGVAISAEPVAPLPPADASPRSLSARKRLDAPPRGPTVPAATEPVAVAPPVPTRASAPSASLSKPRTRPAVTPPGVAPPGVAPPGVRPSPMLGGLADLLEPDDVSDVDDNAAPLIDLDAPSPFAARSPLQASASSSILGRPPVGPATGADLPVVEVDGLRPDTIVPLPARGLVQDNSWDVPAPRSRSGMVYGLVALALMLGGALVWVLYTQTDIFEGDVVAKRDAQAKADAEAELAAKQAEQEKKAKEYGTLTVTSKPEGARVWMVKDGPAATFERLPADGQYMIAVVADGHVPRTRLVRGSELSAPVVMDLDPLPEGQTAAPIPEGPVPKVGRDADKTVDLQLRSNTEGAKLALLIGYTPGVTVVDLDVGQSHTFFVTAEGFERHELVVKGRHWEEQGDALVYDEVVALQPTPEGTPDGDDAEIAIVDDE